MTIRWRPIAECPPDLDRAVVFDPNYARMSGDEVWDERVVLATRSSDGRWSFDDYQGGDYVEPTHFLDPGVPEGFPLTLDPDVLRAREEAARVEREQQAKIEAEAAAAGAALRRAETDAEREAFWADPEKRLRALDGTP